MQEQSVFTSTHFRLESTHPDPNLEKCTGMTAMGRNTIDQSVGSQHNSGGRKPNIHEEALPKELLKERPWAPSGPRPGPGLAFP